ncbi:MAG: [FeFe] hydrogenase H-cluster radical SAM maturase HydE [Candidatus Zixiibacteriota bacterium]
MDRLQEIFDKKTLSHNDLKYLLNIEVGDELLRMYNEAYRIKVETSGKMVYFRGIIEFSNICDKNCFYCGIRHDNKNIVRYMMTLDEILEAAKWVHEVGYGSIVLQSGERRDEKFVSFVEDAVRGIKDISDGKLGITLSFGEQSKKTYQRWYNAGAHRYLIRIETSNPKLYARLHPNDHDFGYRFECLEYLREVGYQVGTGVMIGLPGQTIDDLADDILFFRDNDIDMIGMGPYIPHKDTPMADSLEGDFKYIRERQLDLALKMIGATRICLKDVNIAATTALQALDDIGRELGIRAGANIIMPNVTDTKYRRGYQLYENKPCLDENSSMCQDCLEGRIAKLGETIGYNKWGDSPHYFKRTGEKGDSPHT